MGRKHNFVLREFSTVQDSPVRPMREVTEIRCHSRNSRYEQSHMDWIAILGASGTIGGTLARRLVKHGRNVLLIGRNTDALEQLASALSQPIAKLDLRNSQPQEDALMRATGSNGGLDLGGLVNGVGSVLRKPAHVTTDDEFRQVIETNLFTAFATVRVGAKRLRERGGAIVALASVAAEVGIHNHEAIAAAKRASSAWLAQQRPPTHTTITASTLSARSSTAPIRHAAWGSIRLPPPPLCIRWDGWANPNSSRHLRYGRSLPRTTGSPAR